MSPEAWTFAGVCVTAFTGLAGANLIAARKTRTENRDDHARVRSTLERLDGTVAGLGEDVRELRGDVHDVRDEQRQHLRWHLDHQNAQNGDGR